MPDSLQVKCCYGHLGGTLGNRLFDSMVGKGWFQQDASDAKSYLFTELGLKEFEKFGVNPYKEER
jgi:hypothetical protein